MHRGERLETMDIHAMLRAVRAGRSNRYIADNLGVDRRTVSKYRQVFERQELLTGELPELEQLNRLQNTNRVFLADARNGKSTLVVTETDDAWIDVNDELKWLDCWRLWWRWHVEYLEWRGRFKRWHFPHRSKF